MEIEFVLGLSPPGTSRPGLVKMRGCMTLFEFGTCLFRSSPVISSILLSFHFLLPFVLFFFSLEHDSFVDFSNGCFWWFYTNHVVAHFPLVW